MITLQNSASWLIDSILIEVFLTTAIVVLLGAAVYCLLFCSIINDRRDMKIQRMKKRSGNPWERLIEQEEAPPSIDRKNLIFGFVCLGLAILAIIALVLLYAI